MSEALGSVPAVRVLDASGGTVGVGVLIASQAILTCAHVVNAALGRDRGTRDRPAGEVTVEFVAGGGSRVQAQMRCWSPPPSAGVIGADGDDLAGLILTGAELPPGAIPARLAEDSPLPGQVVDVFGYPPRRPHGTWVEATIRGPIGDHHLQLDSALDSAMRIQPGFSGTPVYHRRTRQVVGLLTAAPPASSGERDSYAITVDRLRQVCSKLPGFTSGVGERTVLHVSDFQVGGTHLFGGNGGVPTGDAHDVFQSLRDDLEWLNEDAGLRPDLMVVTGDLTAHGLPSEFTQAFHILTEFTEAVRLPRRHVVIVPGNHDVNRDACEAHFLQRRSRELEPVAPYWPKWENFTAAFEEFYAGVEGASFTPDQPYTLFEMPDLKVVVAGLNSTMAESHQDGDHYGCVRRRQLRWFETRMGRYRRDEWLRLAAVHHNAMRGAVIEEERLHDTDDLDRSLGQPGLVNLLLHGHTHDGQPYELDSGLLVLSTGSAAKAQRQEIPNQYQLLTISPTGVTHYARRYLS